MSSNDFSRETRQTAQHDCLNFLTSLKTTNLGEIWHLKSPIKMIPFKCCICLQSSKEFLPDFKTVLSDFKRLFSKFQSCSMNRIELCDLHVCKSCWIYFIRVHQLKHQLRLNNEICDADKSLLRSKIRRAQRSSSPWTGNLPSCKGFEVQISASQSNGDSDSYDSGQSVRDSAEAISCSLNNTSDHESLQSCGTAEVPCSKSAANAYDSDVESIELYEITNVVAPTTSSISIAPKSAGEEPTEVTLDDTRESYSETHPAERETLDDNPSISASPPDEEPTEATSDDTSGSSDSESQPVKTHRVTCRSKRLPKNRRTWRIRSSNVKQLSETEFTYLQKYPFSRTDVGFKCGLCSAVSNFHNGSSHNSYNMLKHIHEWHIRNHRVRSTKFPQRFIEIAPNRFQYGKYKVEWIDGNYRCEECGELKAASTSRHKASKIMKHITSQHENSTRSYVCEFCGKVYRTLFGLSEHKKVKHTTSSIRFPCSDCDKTFVSRATALTHHKHVHEGLYKEKFICEICGKEFSQRDLLKDHIAFVHNGQKIKCKDCDKTFGSKIALRVHRHSHLGRKFICDICGMDFTQHYSVTRHKRTAHAQ